MISLRRMPFIIVIVIGIALLAICARTRYCYERQPVVTLLVESISSNVTTLLISNDNPSFVLMEPITSAGIDDTPTRYVVAPRDAISLQVPRGWTNQAGRYEMVCRAEKTSTAGFIRSLLNIGRSRSKLVVFQPKESGWSVFSEAIPANSASTNGKESPIRDLRQ